MPRNARLSFELMETMVELVNSQGDASLAGERLGINQPSMSKRLKLLQDRNRVGSAPWVQRRGKTWSLTAEGERVLPAVLQLLRLEQSLTTDLDTRAALMPTISIACGQTAITSVLREPLTQFRKEFKDCRVRISTPRGTARIQGVANGTFDFALVTHNEDSIHRIAGRQLYIETLFEDTLVLICGRKASPSIRERFEKLPRRGASIKHLGFMPLVLPEPDAGLRNQLDRAFGEAGLFGKLDVMIEVGGWPAILDFVREGWGVGIVTKSSITSEIGLLDPCPLDLPDLPPTAVRLIARQQGSDQQPDLLKEALRLVELLQR